MNVEYIRYSERIRTSSMIVKDGRIHYKLGRIAEGSPYSADYLRVRILQKKLKGIKVGRVWYTNRDWLNDYIFNFASKHKSAEFAPLAEIRPRPQPRAVPVLAAADGHFSDAIKAIEVEIGKDDLASRGGAAINSRIRLLADFSQRLLFAATAVFLLSSLIYTFAHFPLSFYEAAGKASEYLFGIGDDKLKGIFELAGLFPRKIGMTVTRFIGK